MSVCTSRSAPPIFAVPDEPTAARIVRLEAEGLIGMRAVGRMTGVHSATPHRWATDGVLLPDGRRLKLEAVKLAGRLVTSRAAVFRFIERQNENHPATLSQDVPPRSPSARTRASERAAAELARMGC